MGGGAQHPGDAASAGAPPPGALGTGRHLGPGPAAHLPASPTLLLLTTKRQVLSGQGYTPGFLQGSGCLGQHCGQPPPLAGAGRAGELGCSGDAGRVGGSRSGAGGGVPSHLDYRGHGQNGARLPTLSSLVPDRHVAGLSPHPLPPRPEWAGAWEGAFLAEQFQVGDRDLALLVASLADEPVRVHARQAVDSDELKTRAERGGHTAAGAELVPGRHGDRVAVAPRDPGVCTSRGRSSPPHLLDGETASSELQLPFPPRPSSPAGPLRLEGRGGGSPFRFPGAPEPGLGHHPHPRSAGPPHQPAGPARCCRPPRSRRAPGPSGSRWQVGPPPPGRELPLLEGPGQPQRGPRASWLRRWWARCC